MQFAGQRTNLNFEPIGEPYNLLVKLNDDTLPSPDAILVTGITPQQTQADGYTESEFAQILLSEVFTENTIVVGYNNIRFDDEFIRALFWRTFNDPYEWFWSEGRSRWDILDVVRMTRALRPEGINWPVVDGKEVNKLESIASANNITHTRAHDALSDVEALISVAKLISTAQPQLYQHLFKMKDKKQVMELVNLENKQPFVYVSGRYEAEFHKATVAFPLTSGRNNSVVVYNLRHDPSPFLNLTAGQLGEILFASYEQRQQEGFVSLPVKELQYNRAPAVAPLGVLNKEDGWHKIGLDEITIVKNRNTLLSNPSFAENVRSVFESRPEFPKQSNPEARLYDGFITDSEKPNISAVREAKTATQLSDLNPAFTDERLAPLLLHYKARNFPASLAEDEARQWETWRAARVSEQLPVFLQRLSQLAAIYAGNDSKMFILQELQLWAESIAPSELYLRS